MPLADYNQFFFRSPSVADPVELGIFESIKRTMKTADSTYEQFAGAKMEGHLVKIDQWLSDLDFSAEEVQFFKKVIHLYIKRSDTELQERIDVVEKEIASLEQKREALKSEVLNYRQSLEQRGLQQTDIPPEIFQNEKLSYLQSRFNNLNHDMRSLKEDLFSITEDLYGG